ncbi:MAG: potassium-transporting ATPase subunit F [Leptolyngbyaceae cyanobacterium SM2_5_2]|nr:potassium-transporting ATPase subunit F [Leptolyngbyaceae cyanobacterium SM2_5_2]
MNRLNLQPLERLSTWIETLQQRRHRFAVGLFVALCLNLAIAPALYATTGSLERGNAYALGLLGLAVVALAVYLTAVILQPERF